MGGCCSSNARTGKQTEAKYKKNNSSEEKQEARRKNVEYIGTLQALAKVPLLRRLPKDQHPMLAACCVKQVYSPGDVVIKQGDVGNEFFVIRSGEASVFVAGDSSPTKVATVKEGDYFGENALLHDEPRNATIRADTELCCLRISRDKFQELGLHLRLEFAKRQAVRAVTTVDGPVKEQRSPLQEKTQEERSFIIANLQQNQNLQTLGLDEGRAAQLADVAWKQDVANGEEIIKQGEEKADFFYICANGSFDVLISEPAFTDMVGPDGSASEEVQPKAAPRKVGSIQPGNSFGELALMYSVPRAATVLATAASSVWVIERANFKRMLLKASDDEIDGYRGLLQGIEVFNTLLNDELRAIAEALTEMSFSEGEIVLEQGKPGDTFYILYEGEVAVIKGGERVNTLAARKESKVAHYFGERALLYNEPRAATVQVISKGAKALVLDKARFDLLLGSVKEFLKDGSSSTRGISTLSIDRQRRSENRPQAQAKDEAVALEDLDLVGILGAGAFGKVELRESRRTGDTYAVKMMSKGFIVKMKMQNNVINEKEILSSVSSPFIIKLFNTSSSAQWIYFYMEPALGGELYVVYHRKCFHGSSSHARYYVASVISAFEHLHERHVIYRDLKPENLLLTGEGWMKLTDMGLAKFAIGKTYTTCGTPEYFAPEVIRSTGQTRAVDWWTIGILIFELMTGSAPFRAENDMAMYGKVLRGINHVYFPPKAEGATEDIVKNILKTEPSERLPMRSGGLKNLKSHAWFNGFDWEGLVDRSLQPPYLPAVKSKTDLRNFSHVKNHKANWLEWKDDNSGWDQDF